MRSTARRHYVQFLLPSYKDFLEIHNSRCLGVGADHKAAGICAEALLHLPDHIYNDPTLDRCALDNAANVRVYREAQWPRCSAYELVCDFANVFKHCAIRRDGKKLNSMKDVREYIAWVHFDDERGRYHYCRKFLGLVGTNSKVINIEDVIRISFDYWTSKLISLRVIPGWPDVPPRESWFRYRKEVKSIEPVKILGNVGEYLHVEQIQLTWNSATKTTTLRTKKLRKVDSNIAIEVKKSPFKNSV